MKGKVYLVGAGPGDEKLITVKGLEKLQEAEVVVYDRLANPRLLTYCKDDCEYIYVGKAPGNHKATQEEINELLVQKAQEGKKVVRLKGGDPYVFGRGGEEGQALFEENIEFEVIPGISSSIGGLAYGGIPITHRDYAASFHVITGHLKSDEIDQDWEALGRVKGTLVFLMGIGNLSSIVKNLSTYGKTEDTPVAIIHKATTPDQKTITGNLGNIVEIAGRENIKPPSLIVVGEVVRCREQLNFYERKPLFGKKIIVTRARAQNSELVHQIYELGGEAIELPTIKIRPIKTKALQKGIQGLSTYSHIIFSSKNAVHCFFHALYNEQKDSRALGSAKVIAVGKGTAEELKKFGIIPDAIPKQYIGEGIVTLLKDQLAPDTRILLPRSKNARAYLVEELNKICKVDEIPIYETMKETDMDPLNVLGKKSIDYITFTSSSTVQNFIELIGEENRALLESIKIISIGPVTSAKIQDYGLEVHKQAEEHTISGMVRGILEDIKGV